MPRSLFRRRRQKKEKQQDGQQDNDSDSNSADYPVTAAIMSDTGPAPYQVNEDDDESEEGWSDDSGRDSDRFEQEHSGKQQQGQPQYNGSHNTNNNLPGMNDNNNGGVFRNNDSSSDGSSSSDEESAYTSSALGAVPAPYLAGTPAAMSGGRRAQKPAYGGSDRPPSPEPARVGSAGNAMAGGMSPPLQGGGHQYQQQRQPSGDPSQYLGYRGIQESRPTVPRYAPAPGTHGPDPNDNPDAYYDKYKHQQPPPRQQQPQPLTPQKYHPDPPQRGGGGGYNAAGPAAMGAAVAAPPYGQQHQQSPQAYPPQQPPPPQQYAYHTQAPDDEPPLGADASGQYQHGTSYMGQPHPNMGPPQDRDINVQQPGYHQGSSAAALGAAVGVGAANAMESGYDHQQQDPEQAQPEGFRDEGTLGEGDATMAKRYPGSTDSVAWTEAEKRSRKTVTWLLVTLAVVLVCLAALAGGLIGALVFSNNGSGDDASRDATDPGFTTQAPVVAPTTQAPVAAPSPSAGGGTEAPSPCIPDPFSGKSCPEAPTPVAPTTPAVPTPVAPTPEPPTAPTAPEPCVPDPFSGITCPDEQLAPAPAPAPAPTPTLPTAPEPCVPDPFSGITCPDDSTQPAPTPADPSAPTPCVPDPFTGITCPDDTQPAPAPVPDPAPAPSPAGGASITNQALFTTIANASPDQGAEMLKDGTPQNLAFLSIQEENSGLDNARQIQRYALRTLYYSTNGPTTWTVKTGWNPIPGQATIDECLWYSQASGGMCDGDVVNTIEFVGNRLTGTLPAELGMLPGVKRFYIKGVEGQPGLSGGLPTEMGNWNGMEVLVLNDHQFTSPLPDTLFSNWSGATVINIVNSQMPGPVPSSISALSGVTNLNLSKNQFSGNFPAVSGLSNLVLFSIEENAMNGPMPSGTWSGLAKVRNFNAGKNQFSGTIASDIGDMTALKTELNLSNNRFTGGMPASLNNLASLQALLLQNNLLTGAVVDLSALTSLREVRLEGNQLTGTVGAGTCAAFQAGPATSYADCAGGGSLVCGCCTVCCAQGSPECARR